MRFRSGRILLSLSLLLLSVGLYAAHRIGGEIAPATPVERGLEAIGSADIPVDDIFSQALRRLEARLESHPADHEASLLKALILFKTGDRPGALQVLEQLTRRAPKFHLAHLIRGDLLLAQARYVPEIGDNPLLSRLEPTEKGLLLLREEAEARLKAYLDTLPQGRIPGNLLQLSERSPTAVVVDKEAHRLYVYRRDASGVPRLVRDFYVSTGKRDGNKLLRGDLRTPEGVYFVTSHIPDEKLPDKYGVGAFPINYPNELDRRWGKTGDGIWLHGTETAYYSRPPLDSEGCVVLPNIDLKLAGRYIQPGLTPVVIAGSIDWLEEPEWQSQRAELAKMLETWRRDWEGLDTEAYLGHYSKNFRSGRHDLKSWRKYKRRVASGKTFQEIVLDDISLFIYPRGAGNGKQLAVANFRQHYRSNNFQGRMKKRLYLVHEGGGWKILHEGAQ